MEMNRMRPLIGITTTTYDRRHEGVSRRSSAVSLAYTQAVLQAGALPVLLPNLPTADDADTLLARLDGLILSGGGDVDPACWGEPRHPSLGHVDPARDAFEIALLRAAMRRDLPLLGICRGIQVMAVGAGGDLWQDIPSQIPADVGHYQRGLRHEAFHAVNIAPDSRLARMLGLGAGADDNSCRIRVNSFHHQAARSYGTFFAPVAWSDDGVIEALIAPEAAWMLGVQWHPEDMASRDPLQLRLFAAFVQAAGGGAAEQ